MAVPPNVPFEPSAAPAFEKQPPAFDGPPAWHNEQDSAGIKKAIGKTMGTIWVFLGSQVVLSFIFSLILTIVLETAYSMDLLYFWPFSGLLGWLYDSREVLITILAVILPGILTAWFGSSQMDIHLFKELSPRKIEWKWLFKGTAMMYTLSFSLGIVLTLFNLIASRFGFGIPEVSLPSTYNLFTYLLLFLCVAVIGPLLEECVFRGVICKGLSRFNKGFAVVFSALLFGLVHLNFAQGIPAFGMGLVLGFVYLRTGNLMIPAGMHMINNAVSMLAQLVPQGSPLTIVFSLGIAALAILGLFFLLEQKNEIGGMLSQCSRAVLEWKTVARSFSFWLLPACFLLFQVMSVLMRFLMEWFLYTFGMF